MWIRFVVLVTSLSSLVSQATAQSLEAIAETGTLAIGYRTDASPFSFQTDAGEPAGYSLDLCARIADAVAAEVDDLAVDHVPVTAEDRFDALETGRIDILCGATTVTLSRRAEFDFSLLTFVTGTSVLVRRDSPVEEFDDVAGKAIGVLGATTTEEGLRLTLEARAIEAEVVTVASHPEGLQALEAGEIDAYFGDRVILLALTASAADPTSLGVANEWLSYEPYALVMRRGDDDFRLLVDRTLATLYRSGDIGGIFRAAFGDADPSDMLRAMYALQGLPE